MVSTVSQSTSWRWRFSAVAVVLLSLGITACGSKEEATKPQATSVKLETLEQNSLVDSSEYVGTMEAKDRVTLAPRTDGRIVSIFVQRGDFVKRGQPIVELEPTQEKEDVNAATQAVNVERARLGQNQAELRTAEANRAAASAQVESARADVQEASSAVELAEININRTKMLVEGGALAQQELDDDTREMRSTTAQLSSRQETLNAATESLNAAERQVEQARANINRQNATIQQTQAQLASISQNLAYNTISAPIDGIVGDFDTKKVGDYVSVGEELSTITSNEDFDLNINVPVENRDRLTPGLKVQTVNSDGSTGIEGQISYVAPLVRQDTQSLLAKATFPSSSSLRDREYVRVRVIWDEEPGVLVPTTAVSTLGGQNFVYVAKEQSEVEESAQSQSESESSQAQESSAQELPPEALIAQQQPVKLGSIQGQSYQVISGVKEGDRIAVSNILSLRDGSPIQPAAEEVGSSSMENSASTQ